MSEVTNLGPDASAEDVRRFRQDWTSQRHPDDYCGGAVGVALAWFVAGGLVALAVVAVAVLV